MVKYAINSIRTKLDRRGIMHVRATTVQVQSGKMPDVIDILNQVLLAAKAVKGF